MTSPDPSGTRTLIDELLAEQQELTAVERFSQRHEASELPAQSRYYRDLIPLAKPRPGEQYAFVVDLDSCSGCKACVTACHSLNGLDDHEAWRTVGLLHGGSEAAPFQQTVTSACHHCVDPACLNGCPVLAYEKDPLTGIVRHLDDQCIGCQYCVLKCPYDVPKYSSARGIVRKCDMCHSRLAANEAPACVQACPSGAIAIRVVNQAEVTRNSNASGARLLPGVFESDYTKPTTMYTSRKPRPHDACSADAETLRLEPAHWPLVWMLVLTQLSAGIFFWGWAAVLFRPEAYAAGKIPITAAGTAALVVGLAISVLHLGRPLGAWRAFLGLRRSWMSREIVAFGAFAFLAATATLAAGSAKAPDAGAKLIGVTTLAGIVGVFCSVMVYVDTRRVFWRGSLTFTKFFGTALLLGAAGLSVGFAWLTSGRPVLAGAAHAGAWIATAICAALFVLENSELAMALRHPCEDDHSALVIWKLLRPLVAARVLLFVISAAAGIPAIELSGRAAAVCATISFLSIFASQAIERYYFFTAVTAPKMPGTAGL